MPGSTVKCFKTDSNEFKSSNDHINKKKALAIYNIVKEQSKTNSQVKDDKTEYNGPVFINQGGFLGAVGGYNTDNYDLKLNVAKGRAYSEMPCVVSTDLSTNATTNVVLYNPNDVCINSVSKCQIPNSTYELFEGPYLIKTATNTYSSEDCQLKSRQLKLRLQYTTFDPSNITTNSFSKLANDDKLQNLNLNSKLPLICGGGFGATIFIGSLYLIDIIGELLSSKYTSIISKLEIKEVLIGTNVTSIGQDAFSSCSNLKAISIPNSVLSIDASGFALCTALTSITIPKSVTTISNEAFNGCSSLASIRFETPSAITTIGGTGTTNWAFANIIPTPTFNLCFNDITLVEAFSTTISGSFENICSNVPAQTTHFKLSGNSEALINIQNDLLPTAYDLTSTYNIVQANITSVDIGTNVTSLGTNAFKDCESLASITIPDLVITIGSSAFKSCSSLSAITIPSSVTSIGVSCFEDSSLNSLTYENITYYTSNSFKSVFTGGVGADAFKNTPFLSKWDQLGSNISGDTAGDKFGTSVSLNQDGTKVAIGAPQAASAGQCQIYEWQNNTSWVQLGSNISGDTAGDTLGNSVSLNQDGTIVAIGAPNNDAGQCQIYEWQNNTSWVQLGSNISGDTAGDQFGTSVSLSQDGTKVAIGAPHNDDGASGAGLCQIYELSNNSWVQLGSNISGTDVNEALGVSVSLNQDGTKVAIGAIGANSFAGQCQIYELSNNSWVQLGSNISGTDVFETLGFSVSLNQDGTKVAIGATGANLAAGQCQIYEWQNNTSWVQLGSNISGDTSAETLGCSVSLNQDGTKVAIGATGANLAAGQCQIYEWQNNTSWVQLGQDISGVAVNDHLGNSVSLSQDGTKVAVGAPNNADGGIDAGQCQIYEYS